MNQKPLCPFAPGDPIAWQVDTPDLLFWTGLGVELHARDGHRYVLLEVISGDRFGASDSNCRLWKYGQQVQAGGRTFFLKYLSEAQVTADLRDDRPDYAAQEASFWSFSPWLCRSYGSQTISHHRTNYVLGRPGGSDAAYHAVLLENIPGEPAPAWFRRYCPDTPSPALALHLTRQLLQAIASYGVGPNAARHLDIRPHNIMLEGSGLPRLRLFDYDWSHTDCGRGHTLLLLRHSYIDGNNYYRIPLGSAPVSCRCDLYQFALTVYYFFFGEHCRAEFPANADDLTDPRNYGVPDKLRARLTACGLDGLIPILDRCLSRLDGPSGYRDVSETLRDFEALPCGPAAAPAASPVRVECRLLENNRVRFARQLTLVPYQPYHLTVGVSICRTPRDKTYLGQTLASVYWDPAAGELRALLWQAPLCSVIPQSPDCIQLPLLLTPDGAYDSAVPMNCIFSLLSLPKEGY